MRTTLAQIKASRIPVFINIKPTDSRFIPYVNEYQQRVITRGLFWGSYGLYQASLTSQLFTLPAYIATLEGAAISNTPVPIRDGNFCQFVSEGWGIRNKTLPNGSGVSEVMYIGNFPVATDPPASGTLTLKCDVAADVGKIATIMGLDQNGNIIRTSPGGNWQSGEQVAMAQGAGTNTANQFSKITDVILPTGMVGQSWLYQGGIGGTLLSNYQWYEGNPSYKRYLVPFVTPTVSTIDFVAKNAFVPVAVDTDFVVIGNLAAMKLGMRAIKAEEESDWSTANLLWNGGTDKKTGQKIIGVLGELDDELTQEVGHGRETTIDVNTMFHSDSVETFV